MRLRSDRTKKEKLSIHSDKTNKEKLSLGNNKWPFLCFTRTQIEPVDNNKKL